MQAFTVTTFINRPLQEVFDFVSNLNNDPQWQEGVGSVKITSAGPVGVGTTYQGAGRAMGRDIEVNMEIVQWNPPNMRGYKVRSGPMHLEETTKFESQNGGTLLIRSFDAEIGGFFKIAEGLAIKQYKRKVESDGNTLKSLLEAK